MQCVDRAIQRAIDVSELIYSVIADDNLKRFFPYSVIFLTDAHMYLPNLIETF